MDEFKPKVKRIGSLTEDELITLVNNKINLRDKIQQELFNSKRYLFDESLREELKKIVRKDVDFKKALSDVLLPDKLKADLRKIFKNMIHDETRSVVKGDLKQMFGDTLVKIAEETLSSKLKDRLDSENIQKLIKERVDELMSKDFDGFVAKIYGTVFKKVTSHLTTTLTNKITLKTSDMRILADDVRMMTFDEKQLRSRGLCMYKGDLIEISKKKHLMELENSAEKNKLLTNSSESKLVDWSDDLLIEGVD